MKALLCIAITACAAGGAALICLAQAGPPLERPPAAVLDLQIDPRVLDFGEVLDGEEPVAFVSIRNAGDRAVTITQVYSGCGCAVPRVIFDDGVEVDIAQKTLRAAVGAIEPGCKARLEVRFVTHGYNGEIRKHIRIETDHPQAPYVNVGITALIKKAISLVPETVAFGEIVRGQVAERDILLLSKGIGSFSVSGIGNLPPYLTYEAKPDPEAAARHGMDCAQRLTLRLHGDYPLGESRLLPLASIDHERIKTVRVPVTMNVQPKVVYTAGGVALSGNLDLGVFPTREGRAIAVDVVNLVPAIPYNVLSVTVEEPAEGALEAELETVEPGVRYRLNIRVKPGLAAGYVRGAVSVISDHPDMMLKKIRILGFAIGA